MNQVTKDENVVSLVSFYDPKILFYKYITNKFTKDPDNYDHYIKDFNHRAFNKEIIKMYYRKYLKEYYKKVGKNLKQLSDEELEFAQKDFTERFKKGEYLPHPELYMNT